MGKREGVFCDFTTTTGSLCPNLALGPCALCEKDVCHEAHSLLRDKFIPGATGEGCGIGITIQVFGTQVAGGTPSQVSITSLNKASERVLVCILCGMAVNHKIAGAGSVARDALVSALRATLTAATLRERDAND